jgi:hypothetical protein
MVLQVRGSQPLQSLSLKQLDFHISTLVLCIDVLRYKVSAQEFHRRMNKLLPPLQRLLTSHLMALSVA